MKSTGILKGNFKDFLSHWHLLFADAFFYLQGCLIHLTLFFRFKSYLNFSSFTDIALN
jgi:hypothetical protein